MVNLRNNLYNSIFECMKYAGTGYGIYIKLYNYNKIYSLQNISKPINFSFKIQQNDLWYHTRNVY